MRFIMSDVRDSRRASCSGEPGASLVAWSWRWRAFMAARVFMARERRVGPIITQPMVMKGWVGGEFQKEIVARMVW